MTLIAAMEMRGFPVMIGDLLISSSHPDAKQIQLPSVGQLPEQFTPDGIYIFSNLGQKLTTINASLLVGWSGSVSHAKTFLRELRKESRKSPLSKEGLQSFVNSIRKDMSPHCDMFCVLANKKETSVFTINIPSLPTEKYGECFVGGSGAGRFISQIYSQRDPDNELSGDWRDQLSQAFVLLGDAFGDELSGAPNFSFHYGGGYELAIVNSGKIQKIGDTLYLFWELEIGQQQPILSWLPALFKIDYLGELLCIRRLEKEGQNLKGTHHYIVGPIDVAIDQRAIDLSRLPDLNARFLVNHIRIVDNEQQTGAHISVAISGRGKGPFIIEEEPNRIGFKLQKSFFTDQFRGAMGGKDAVITLRF